MERYNTLSSFYKEKFGEKTLKICVDGGFSCPNRDGTKGVEGCIFCSEKGSGELIKERNQHISTQVKKYFDSYRARRANKFIVYFQNFSNTYDSLQNLKQKYDSSLVDKRIVGIDIATRSDCLNEEKVKLIKSYSKNYYVCVELGLQTANENQGDLINRMYTTQEFIDAVKLLNKYEIDVVAHIICGLPGEDRASYFNEKDKSKLFEKESLQTGKYIPDTIKETICLVNSLDISGIKIHSCYVVKNTKLNEMYQKGKYNPLELDEYLSDLSYIITHLNKKIIIHRICADGPKDILVAPDWNLHKKWVLNGFNKIMEENNLWQGMFL